jgi:hypothetical protein
MIENKIVGLIRIRQSLGWREREDPRKMHEYMALIEDCMEWRSQDRVGGDTR